jgi:hypothetical protein
MKSKQLVICELLNEHPTFLDNITGKCRRCKRLIMYRPYMPRQAHRICIDCFNKYYDGVDCELVVTERQKKELENLFTKN